MKHGKILTKLIKKHEDGNCTCEGFSETHDTRMCDAYAYLSGNISKEDVLESVGIINTPTEKYIIQDSFGNQAHTNDLSEALAYVEDYKSMLEDYEEYVTLFERVKDNNLKGIRTWFINLDSSANKYLDTKF